MIADEESESVLLAGKTDGYFNGGGASCTGEVFLDPPHKVDGSGSFLITPNKTLGMRVEAKPTGDGKMSIRFISVTTN